MKLFQNRIVAVLLAVILLAGGFLLSSYLGMKRDLDRLQASFFSGEGRSPVYYVDQQISAAASLAATADRYDALSGEAVRSARKDLIRAEESRDISDIYDASTALSAAVDDLAAAAAGVSLSREDADAFADDTAVVAGARVQLLEKSGYNTAARELIEKNYRSFPGSFLASALRIPEPELFEEVAP